MSLSSMPIAGPAPASGSTTHKQPRTRRRHGLRLTSPAQTLADLPPHELEHAYNEALVLNLVTHQEVRAFAARSRALRDLVEEVPGMTRSRMERALRALIKQAGLPAPQSNVKVHGHEVDMYWPAHRLVVEFDGWNTHSTRTAFESGPPERRRAAARRRARDPRHRPPAGTPSARARGSPGGRDIDHAANPGPVGKLTHGRKANPESFIPRGAVAEYVDEGSGYFRLPTPSPDRRNDRALAIK